MSVLRYILLVTITSYITVCYAQKSQIKVKTSIEAETFLGHFFPAEIDSIEEKSSRRIAQMLNEAIPVYEFVTIENVVDSMEVKLVQKDQSSIVELHLIIEIRGESIKEQSIISLKFPEIGKTYDEYMLQWDFLQMGMFNVINSSLKQDLEYKEWVENLFSNVRIGVEVDTLLFSDPASWRFMSSYKDLKLNKSSEFTIVGKYREGLGDLERWYHCVAIGTYGEFPNGRIITEALPQNKQDFDLDSHQREKLVKSIGIYLRRFKRMDEQLSNINF